MSTQPNLTQTFTIKEAANLTGLAESNLRYYETIGLIPHVARDNSSKYRVYSEADIDYIVSIACLSATGMSIGDMRKYLINRGGGADVADEQIALFVGQKEHLLEEEKQLKVRQKYIDLKVAYWNAVKEGKEDARALIAKESKLLSREINRT